MKSLVIILCIGLTFLSVAALAADGTQEGATPTAGDFKAAAVSRHTDDTYVISPFESVSISQTATWQDNRHRAYFSTDIGNVNGFLLFDVSQIPDDAQITSMTLRCYLENAFGSPYANPIVDIYCSGDDNWTRGTATPGSLSLDVLVTDNVGFVSYVPQYDFTINVAAHNWTEDLLDNRICFGFKDDVNYYSYVYFFGAYGSPVGPAPELTIATGPATQPEVIVNLVPFVYPIEIPAVGGSFDFYAFATNPLDCTQAVTFWSKQIDPQGNITQPMLGPASMSLPPGTRGWVRNQSVPGSALPGVYTYIGCAGIYPNTVSASDTLMYTKLTTGDGPWVSEWSGWSEAFEGTGANFRMSGATPNPFNPTTTIRFELPAFSLVELRVYDSAGRLAATLVDGWRDAGEQQVTFDASALPSGVYFAHLRAGNLTAVQKLALVK